MQLRPYSIAGFASLRWLVVSATAASVFPAIAAPSFMCKDATLWADKAVCSSVEVSRLDLDLAAAYSQLRSTLSGTNRERLVSQQREFLNRRNECRHAADAAACLRTAYSDRLRALEDRLAAQRPPASDAASGPQWADSLATYFRAIEVCQRSAPVQWVAVSSAWITAQGNVGLKVRDAARNGYLCYAAKDGSAMASFAAVDSSQQLPADGALFFPTGSDPYRGECFDREQVQDESGRPVGWLLRGRC